MWDVTISQSPRGVILICIFLFLPSTRPFGSLLASGSMGTPKLSESRVSSQKQNREGVVGAQSKKYRAMVESGRGSGPAWAGMRHSTLSLPLYLLSLSPSRTLSPLLTVHTWCIVIPTNIFQIEATTNFISSSRVQNT